ncbi:MAG: putative bifunctional diguanylate cyclase/phosphodiesterase [Pyrinomonadaceae bacterium]
MELDKSEKPRILIIDDDEQIRQLLLDILSAIYDCREVSSAEDALGVLGRESFDLVISDINMGGMSGLELVPHVHAISPDSIVLMISGQSNIETAIEAMHAGAFDYVMKPLEIRQVEAAVERALKQCLLLREKKSYKDQLENLLKQRTAEVNRLAYYDTLTELPNRTLYEDRLAQALALAQRTGKTLAVLFISFDQLKKVNDTLGHALGDHLLKEVAARVRACVSESDTVARFGGDLAVMLSQIEGAEDVVEIIGCIRENMNRSLRLDGQELFATASVGVSMFPDDGQESNSLIKNAGAALYLAKKSGGNAYQFYTPDMHALASKRFALETSLRHAVDNEEFLIHYQPRVAIDSLQIVGVEALVRWQHPELGLVSPAEFIPLAEETGLILPLGEWVLRTACKQNRKWQDKGFPAMSVGVNISARQFQQQHLAETVIRILDEVGLAPRFLELELTESSIMSNVAVDVLTGLKRQGVTVSVDDFGTGFSSLSYLKRLPINALKIDQSFVRDLTTDPDDAALVMAIVTLAHNLRLRVVAEGVETEEQLRFLRLLRCDEIQGYLISKPLPVEALEKLLQVDAGQPLGSASLS